MNELFKIFSWTVRSIFIGMGVYLGYIILTSIFDRLESLDNVFARIIFFTAIGGMTNYIFTLLSETQKNNT